MHRSDALNGKDCVTFHEDLLHEKQDFSGTLGYYFSKPHDKKAAKHHSSYASCGASEGLCRACRSKPRTLFPALFDEYSNEATDESMTSASVLRSENSIALSSSQRLDHQDRFQEISQTGYESINHRSTLLNFQHILEAYFHNADLDKTLDKKPVCTDPNINSVYSVLRLTIRIANSLYHEHWPKQNLSKIEIAHFLFNSCTKVTSSQELERKNSTPDAFPALYCQSFYASKNHNQNVESRANGARVAFCGKLIYLGMIKRLSLSLTDLMHVAQRFERRISIRGLHKPSVASIENPCDRNFTTLCTLFAYFLNPHTPRVIDKEAQHMLLRNASSYKRHVANGEFCTGFGDYAIKATSPNDERVACFSMFLLGYKSDPEAEENLKNLFSCTFLGRANGVNSENMCESDQLSVNEKNATTTAKSYLHAFEAFEKVESENGCDGDNQNRLNFKKEVFWHHRAVALSFSVGWQIFRCQLKPEKLIAYFLNVAPVLFAPVNFARVTGDAITSDLELEVDLDKAISMQGKVFSYKIKESALISKHPYCIVIAIGLGLIESNTLHAAYYLLSPFIEHVASEKQRKCLPACFSAWPISEVFLRFFLADMVMLEFTENSMFQNSSKSGTKYQIAWDRMNLRSRKYLKSSCSEVYIVAHDVARLLALSIAKKGTCNHFLTGSIRNFLLKILSEFEKQEFADSTIAVEQFLLIAVLALSITQLGSNDKDLRKLIDSLEVEPSTDETSEICPRSVGNLGRSIGSLLSRKNAIFKSHIIQFMRILACMAPESIHNITLLTTILSHLTKDTSASDVSIFASFMRSLLKASVNGTNQAMKANS